MPAPTCAWPTPRTRSSRRPRRPGRLRGLGGDGLRPSGEGKRVSFTGDQRIVMDGPFAESKEVIAGYWVWQVQSMEEAVEWVRRCPHPMPGEDTQIEIRPLYEAEDFTKLFETE